MSEENIDFILFLIPYILIPIINAVVGWGTNWLALKMTFYPIEFTGIPPYGGWQGIIPSKAASMAQKSVDMLTAHLLDTTELFERMDPAQVAAEMEAEVRRLTRKIIDEVMMAQAPMVWRAMPSQAKKAIYNKASEDIPAIVTEMMSDMKENIDELFDVKTMVVNILVNNKQLLNDMFEECGHKEFRFIEMSGVYFGFLFGVIQAIVWYFYSEGWVLPAFGALVGYATNAIAMKIIFEPLEPIRIGPWSFQGLFIKRQHEVAAVYARIVAQNILTMPNIFDSITRGNTVDKLTEIVHIHIDAAVNDAAGSSREMVTALAGKRIEIAKNIATYRFMEELPISIRKVFNYAEKALAIEATLREKMQGLSAIEFEGFLHPVFQEDEWKLILVGTILGCLAGAAQLFMF